MSFHHLEQAEASRLCWISRVLVRKLALIVSSSAAPTLNSLTLIPQVLGCRRLKVENVKAGNAGGIPKHHRKVTHHEYEVETANGRTITKKRKTRSTVLFEACIFFSLNAINPIDDPRKQKIKTPKTNTPRTVVKSMRVEDHPRPSNIGDLFSEGSLNPYADDPYAFD
ncbi:unnamed protein product [Trifolium pratense]|uniref:Uncharacterized protein n=1 Tax=Trifolium pratense TaxID=57577 RepID=A0ACB0L2B9_TRIPR|nr:unnamed protein product [Trifolium pratense]